LNNLFGLYLRSVKAADIFRSQPNGRCQFNFHRLYSLFPLSRGNCKISETHSIPLGRKATQSIITSIPDCIQHLLHLIAQLNRVLRRPLQ
jgi:hypothetical protein